MQQAFLAFFLTLIKVYVNITKLVKAYKLEEVKMDHIPTLRYTPLKNEIHYSFYNHKHCTHFMN